MDWALLSGIGEIAGAIAVIVTLLYLARQVKISHRHDLLGAFQHTYDSLNSWCIATYASPDVAEIVIRGRRSYDDLTEVERFRFDHVHIHLVNMIESHLYQVTQTSMDAEYRVWAIANLELIAKGYLGHPGTRQFWEGIKDYTKPEARELISRSIATSAAYADGGASLVGPEVSPDFQRP